MDKKRRGQVTALALNFSNGRHLSRMADQLLSDTALSATFAISCCKEQCVPTPASHLFCMACGNSQSLGLRFVVSNGGVTTSVQARPEWQGYEGILHGGMIATLLDAAMTHCLFHHQIEAMTASLQVLYLAPVLCAGNIDLAARLVGNRKLIYELSAELRVSGEIKARADAKFMRHRNEPSSSTRT